MLPDIGEFCRRTGSLRKPPPLPDMASTSVSQRVLANLHAHEAEGSDYTQQAQHLDYDARSLFLGQGHSRQVCGRTDVRAPSNVPRFSCASRMPTTRRAQQGVSRPVRSGHPRQLLTPVRAWTAATTPLT